MVLGGFVYSPLGRKDCVMRNFVMPIVIGVVAMCCMMFGSAEVFAQTNDVTFTPIVNFGDLFTTLTGVLGPIVAAALGLGLAIWGARYVFSIIRSMGR